MDAVQKLDEGLSCSQAVLAAYAECLGLERGRVLGLAAGFAGGMGIGLTCGAAGAGVMVLGERLRMLGRDEMVKEMVPGFLREFAARQGSTQCAELLAMHGLDLGMENIGPTLRALGICRSKVQDAVSIARDMLRPWSALESSGGLLIGSPHGPAAHPDRP